MDNTIKPYNEICRHPNMDNPFMNYMTYNEDFLSSCPYTENIVSEINYNFNKTIINSQDPSDIWNRKISDRNFYTMPNTKKINNQDEFAKWCYGNIDDNVKTNRLNIGNCKTYGKNCLKHTYR